MNVFHISAPIIPFLFSLLGLLGPHPIYLVRLCQVASAAVVYAGEVAIGIVGVAALEQIAILLANTERKGDRFIFREKINLSPLC